MKDTVFQQILKPLTHKLLQECSNRFRSDYHCEKFLTWQHLQTMIYAHLNEIKSLSTLEAAINSQKNRNKLQSKALDFKRCEPKKAGGMFFLDIRTADVFITKKVAKKY